MPDRPTVYIVDDDDAVRDAMGALLHAEGLATEAYADAASFLNALPLRQPSCVLLDIRMPGGDGLAVLEKLNKEEPMVPVLMVTGHADLALAVRALRGGATDFFEKPVSGRALVDGVKRALERGARPSAAPVLPDDARERARQRFSSLTDREREVMKGLVAGKANKVIAYELDISPRTVEVHRAHVMRKVRAGSLAELVRLAVAAGEAPLLDDLPT